MNCDQAFDAMTDPECPDNAELSRHLSSCPRCRQMYETLEPALGLFAAVEDKPVKDSPAIPTPTASRSPRLAQRIAGRLTPAGPSSPGEPLRRRRWGAVFAAAIAGFVLSVGLGSMLSAPQPAAPGAATDCSWLNRRAVSDDEPARSLVIACIGCHLSQRGASAPGQAGVESFPQEWDQFITAWQAAARAPAVEPLLMADLFPLNNHRVGGHRCSRVDIVRRSPWHA